MKRIFPYQLGFIVCLDFDENFEYFDTDYDNPAIQPGRIFSPLSLKRFPEDLPPERG